MSIQSRLQKAESAASAGELPILAVFQDWDDCELWHVGRRDGEAITAGELDALAETHTLLKVTYTKDWRGEDEY